MTVQYSSWDLTNVQYRVRKVVTSFRPLHVLLMRPRILLALLDILSIWAFQDSVLVVTKPRSQNSDVSSKVLFHLLPIISHKLSFFEFSG